VASGHEKKKKRAQKKKTGITIPHPDGGVKIFLTELGSLREWFNIYIDRGIMVSQSHVENLGLLVSGK